MTTAEYLGPTLVTATVVPARAAYLVGHSSSSGFLRAVQEASTRWGGVTEPILPVDNDGLLAPWWIQAAKLCDVQAVVNVDVSPESASKIGAKLGLPVVDIAHIDEREPTNMTGHPTHFASVVHPDSGQLFVAPSGEDLLWAAAAAGALTPQHYDALTNSGTSHVIQIPYPDQLARAQLRGHTLISQTASQFAVSQGGSNFIGERPAVIVLTDGKSLTDCIHFWNLRALMPLGLLEWPMVILPAHDLPNWLNIDQAIQAMLGRSGAFSPDVLLLSSSVDESDMHDTAALLGLNLSQEGVKVGLSFPARTRMPPYSYRIAGDIRHLFNEERHYGVGVDADMHLFRGQLSPVTFRNPVSFSSDIAHGLLRLSSGPLSRLPRRGSTAQLVRDDARWVRDGVEINIYLRKEYRLMFQIPTLEDATYAALGEIVGSHELSDKGKLGQALRRNIDLNILLQAGVYEAMIALTTPRSKELLRELRKAGGEGVPEGHLIEIAASWGGRSERRYRTAKQVTSDIGIPAQQALESLCSIGWVERGLEVSCGRCGIRSFVPMPATTDVARCPGCNTENSYSVTPAGDALAVQYRLNALVDRSADQGVIPHLLVEAAICNSPDRGFLVPGLNLIFKDGEKNEVDVFGVLDARMLSGEVKTKASEFSEEQIFRDIEVSRKLGVDLHLVGCIQPIPENSRVAIEALCGKAGLEMMICDGPVLRPASAHHA